MHVIIVDDEAIVRHGIRHSVDWSELGFERVEEAAHGLEVLDHWEEWQPDVIVTDIKMPVMDGIALIREARRRDPECICIVLSCADEFELVKEALLVGAADYLLKMTVRPEELMDCMRKITQEHRSRVRVMQETATINEGERRTAFFRQLSTGRYNPDEIEEMAKQCGLQGRFEVFMIAVLQVKGARQSRGKIEALRDEAWYRLGEWLAQEEKKQTFLCSQIDDGEYALLFEMERAGSSEDEDAAVWAYHHNSALARDLQQHLHPLLQHCSEELGLEVRCGVSNAGGGLQRLQRAYHEAKTAVNDHLFRQQSAVLLYANRHDEPPARSSTAVRAQFDQAFRQRLTQALLTGSLEEAEETIDHYFGLLSAGNCTADTARDCIDKAVAILSVAAMEMSCLAGWSEYRLVEDFEGEAFPLYWSCPETAAYLKRYCRYLFAARHTQRHKGERNVVRQIRAYMQEHYQEKITLEQMAARFYLNKNYLSQLFKVEAGINFTRYLNAVRVEKAKELILHTSLSIQEIAEMTGFGDFRYFSRVFRAHTGQSPTEFKAAKTGK
ncbi:helix-turn-helix domain-containing protein [Paenibacillus sp. GCM10027626]|uniref:helix-turn-helix domain-containing protein n=1 Tax=Paenibacillus sp. GCM10027626 TaxID=3273411 RepID=UPI00362E7A44